MPEEEYQMMRKANAVAAGAEPATMPDAKWAKEYPNVSQYLVDPSWDDGTPRELSSLAVQIQDGQVRLALNDKENRQSAYTNAGSVDAALKLLEAALAKETVTWHPWDRKKGKQKG